MSDQQMTVTELVAELHRVRGERMQVLRNVIDPMLEEERRLRELVNETPAVDPTEIDMKLKLRTPSKQDRYQLTASANRDLKRLMRPDRGPPEVHA